MLLANVTALEKGAKRMMQIREEEEEEKEVEQEKGKNSGSGSIEGLHARRLLHWFIKSTPPPLSTTPPAKDDDDSSSSSSSSSSSDEWQYVASVTTNITQLQQGRDLLRRRSTNLLPQLLPSLRSPSVVRRRGVCSSIRNICFEKEDHWYLMEELNLIPYLLYPLMNSSNTTVLTAEDSLLLGLDPLVTVRGEKEKVVEGDVDVRRLLLETLLLFCSSRRGREGLRKREVYQVIRDLDQEYETNDDNNMVIYKLVNFLMRDEEGEGGESSSSSSSGDGGSGSSSSGGKSESAPVTVVKEKNVMDMLD